MKYENRFRPFLVELLIELIYCWQSKATEQLRLEAAIMVTRKHCGNLRDSLLTQPFVKDEEEISFFKFIQPQFTGRLCFYTIMYEAIVSAPSDPAEAHEFWQYEQKRYSRFLEKNHLYIEYLESGATIDDHKYFLRRTNRQPQQFHSKLYGIHPDYFTTLDHLSSALFAEKLYYSYVVTRSAILQAY